ncbi:metallothionein [Coleofasciculus sp. G2-EDA-02]|uniref:metallothionein n=1 Tax=Coleofasciculus sp. G2-EDA-02 TaxID=3069529 RepID=UPI0032F585AA
MTTATQTQCACDSCECMVSNDSAVQKDGKYYCSDACANGHPNGAGCGHSGCACHA